MTHTNNIKSIMNSENITSDDEFYSDNIFSDDELIDFLDDDLCESIIKDNNNNNKDSNLEAVKDKKEKKNRRVKSDRLAVKENMKTETNFPIPETFIDKFGDEAVHDDNLKPSKLKHIKNVRMLNNTYDPLTGKYIKKIWSYKRTKIDRIKRDMIYEYFRHRKTTSIVDTILEAHYKGLKVLQILYFDDPVQHNIIIFDEFIKFYKKVKDERKKLNRPEVSNRTIKKMNADIKVVQERWNYLQETFKLNNNDTIKNTSDKIESYLMDNKMYENYAPHKCDRFVINKDMQMALGTHFDVFILCPHSGMYHEYCTTWDKLLKPFILNGLVK